MAPQGFKYSALDEEDEVKERLLDEAAPASPDVTGPTKRTWLDSLVRLSVYLVIGCTIFDALCVLYLVARSHTRAVDGPTLAFDDLPLRSTYIGLDKLYSSKKSNSSQLSPISNVPHFLGHIDSSAPDERAPLWTKMWVTPDGMVPNDERRTMVTPTISTIAQFHVIDFGMEHCVPQLVIPARRQDAGQDPEYQIDVWALDRNKLLHTEELSWNTRPRRQKFLGTFSGASNSTQSLPGFNCKQGTYQTFELSCRTGNCNLHVHTTGHRLKGFYMIQHQTI